MTLSMILLIIVALAILFGVLERVLDRMALTDRQALLCVSGLFIGGLLPDLSFGLVTINIGGALIPLLICIYLLYRAGSGKERIRALISGALTAASVYAVSLVFPADPTSMPFDPTLLYGVMAGAVAWALGRSRRSSFIAGVLGILICDVITGISNWRFGLNQVVHLGGAGALDVIVLSGVIAVLFCELFGEIMERIVRHRANQPQEGGQQA